MHPDGERSQLLGLVLELMGEGHCLMGNNDKAVEFTRQAVTECRKRRDSNGKAGFCRNLAEENRKN